MIEVTVLLATYNGAKVLPRIFEGYALQKGITFDWKLVVVDNNSTDQTQEIIEDYQNRLRIEPVFEPVAGKNRALNTGLQVIEGGAVIITDDDAVPEPDFLASWRGVLLEQSCYDIFGGSIEPVFDVSPPKWMSQGRVKFEELFAARALAEGPVDPGEVFGPNMAVRRSVFAQGLKFSESIGPSRNEANYAMGSETEFCTRACSYGHKAWFAPQPRVSHIIRKEQLEPRIWCQRAYRNGRGKAQMVWSKGKPVTRLGYSNAAIAVGSAYQAVLQSIRWGRTITLAPEKKLDALWNYHWNRGYRDEHMRRLTTFRNSGRIGDL